METGTSKSSDDQNKFCLHLILKWNAIRKQRDPKWEKNIFAN